MMPVCPGEVLQAGAAWPDPADQQLAGGGPRHLPDQRGRDRGHLPGGRLGAAQGRGGRQQTVIMSRQCNISTCQTAIKLILS